STPTLIALDKKEKTSQKFVLLDGISLAYNSYTTIDLYHKSNVRLNLEESIGFLPLDTLSDKLLVIFPNDEDVKYTAMIGPSYILSQVNYVVLSESRRGEIEITRAKPLGPSSGNASGFGIRTIGLHNGKIYGLFSVDNFVPSIAELTIED
ncbi:MAG: hypothetical protein GXO48_05575, partial [Chlorobi bacterium]|nr:hypothetical protein [Chlorobiota bacterium]